MSGEKQHQTLHAAIAPLSTHGLESQRYEIQRELGRGATSAVFSALDKLVGEVVALKILHQGPSSPRTLERFRQEVRLARRIAHPNVARTHDLGESRGTLYLTMEYVDGQTFGARLRHHEQLGTRMPVAEVISIAHAIAQGLHAAHQSGVVHRDLKPDNVLLGNDGRVLVTDFGIACALESPDVSGRVVGTPVYMAPEQLAGKEVDPRTDLYALGVVLFEALAGELPFQGATSLDIALARLRTPPRELPAHKDIAPPLRALVESMLSRDPARRPRSADEVAQRLGRLARGEVDELDEVAALFRAGQHQAVVARVFDGVSTTVASAYWPYIVGSLALLGRLDESLAIAASIDEKQPPSIAVPVRFFAIVGLCHAGRYGEALRWVRRNLPATRDADATMRFFAFQGIALVRYFTGEVGRARLPAKRALREAVTAHFPYGRLLALDLSGHVLVQRGEVSAGLRVLEQAENLAASLGAPGHRTSIECARLAYSNRHGRSGGDIESALSRITATSEDNHYALRAAWLELAFRSAIFGDAERGREALERAREEALPERDHRARARLFLVDAILSRLDRSMEAAQRALEEAAVSVDRAEDRVLRAELLVWDHILATRCLGATPRGRPETLVDHMLQALERREPLAAELQSETPLWALLSAPQLPLRGALQRGWLGLVPLLHAPFPGRFLFIVGDTLLSADLGSVGAPVRLPGHAREILEALSEGPRSKEDLVREVWRVARYAAQLHDPVVYTAITRLRRALGPASEWLQTTAQGYALHPEVKTLVLELDPSQRETPSDTITPERSASAPPPALSTDALIPRMLSLLARPLSSAQLAEELGVSEATALRRLRILAGEGTVVREGVGKRTRYRVA